MKEIIAIETNNMFEGKSFIIIKDTFCKFMIEKISLWSSSFESVPHSENSSNPNFKLNFPISSLPVQCLF